MLTRQHLDHLCSLVALHLRDAEKDILLPQLEQILAFVQQLDNCHIDTHLVEQQEGTMPSPCIPYEHHFSDEFMQNIHHTIHDNMPVLRA